MLRFSLFALSGATSLVRGAAVDLSARAESLSNAQEAVVEKLPPRHFAEVGAERVALSYGPFLVPSVKVNMGMKSFTTTNLALPCRDCYVTGFQADLRYPNGTIANVNTGMMLHHTILYNANRKDASCPDLERSIERNFGAGNERGIVDLTRKGTTKTGYYIGPTDIFVMTTDIMNDAEQPREAAVVVEWEYVPAAARFAALRPVWIDIDGNCGSFVNYSNVPVPNPVAFNITMATPWTANFSGEVHSVYNHLHDGGTILDISRGGKLLCHGVAGYGESPGYVAPKKEHGHEHAHQHSDRSEQHGGDDGHDHGGSGAEVGPETVAHISSISNCTESLGQTVAGDKWSVTAHYDLVEHPPMMETDDEPSPIMGIAVVFILP